MHCLPPHCSTYVMKAGSIISKTFHLEVVGWYPEVEAEKCSWQRGSCWGPGWSSLLEPLHLKLVAAGELKHKREEKKKRFNIKLHNCFWPVQQHVGMLHEEDWPPGNPGTGSSLVPISLTPSLRPSFPLAAWDLWQKKKIKILSSLPYTHTALA